MGFLEECSTPSTVEPFLMVHKKVKAEGGNCIVSTISYKYNINDFGAANAEHTLQSCMSLNSHDRSTKDTNDFAVRNTNAFAACRFETDSDTQMFIKQQEDKILDLQTLVDLECMSLNWYDRLNLDDKPMSIKEKEDDILDLKTLVDDRKQDIVYLKHIFEGL